MGLVENVEWIADSEWSKFVELVERSEVREYEKVDQSREHSGNVVQ